MSEIEILTDLPNLREEHVEVLEGLGILSVSDLRAAVTNDDRAREVMDLLVGVGPKTMEIWRGILLTKGGVDEWERIVEDEPALEPEVEVIQEGLESEVEVIYEEDEGLECEDILCTLADLMSFDTSKDKGKAAALGYIKGRMKDAGLNVTVSGKGSPILIARKGKTGLMMIGHVDTLPRGRMKKKMQGMMNGDLVYGRGVADMKGACAAMICAAELLAKGDVPFSIAFTTDSLDSDKGIKRLRDDKLLGLAKAVWLFKPTGMIPVVAETGSHRFSIKIGGEEPIFDLATVLERLKEYTMDSEDIQLYAMHVRAGKKGSDSAPTKAMATVDAEFALPYTADFAGSVISNRAGDMDAKVSSQGGVDPVEYDRSVPLGEELADLTCSCLAAMPVDPDAMQLVKVNRRLCICGPGDVFDSDEDEYISTPDMMEAYEAILEIVDLSRDW